MTKTTHGLAAADVSLYKTASRGYHDRSPITLCVTRRRPPQRAQQGVQHLPHMAQLADFMRYQVHAAIPAVAVHA